MRGMSSLERVGLRSSCLISSHLVHSTTTPPPLFHHLGFYVDGKLMLCGGLTSEGLTRRNVTNNKCFSLSQGSRWRREADIPTTNGFKAAHAVAEGRAFIFGGLEDEVPLANVYSYLSEDNRWSEDAPLTSGRADACAVAHAGSVYITGGSQIAGRHAWQSLGLVERKRVGETSSPWVAMPPLKQARAEHGCAVIKDSKGRTGILVVGGTGEKSCVGTSVEFLDLETEGAKWEAMPSLRNSRSSSPKVGLVELTPVVLGGAKKGVNTVEVFNLTENRWETASYQLKENRTLFDATLVPSSFFSC